MSRILIYRQNLTNQYSASLYHFTESMFERITDNSLPMNPSNNTFILHSASLYHFTKSLFERSIDIHSCRLWAGLLNRYAKMMLPSVASGRKTPYREMSRILIYHQIWQINIQPLFITLQNQCSRGLLVSLINLQKLNAFLFILFWTVFAW